MKKLCILLALIMIPAVVWGVSVSSIENDASYGLFSNEMDAASSVGGGFLDLDKTYIFGGLANIDKATITGSGDATVGAFIYGDMPWSVFVDLEHVSPAAGAVLKKTDENYYSFTTITSGPATDTSTETYEWVDQNTLTKYDSKLLDEMHDDFQFITIYDGMVVGAELSLDKVNNSPMGNNFTQKDTFYDDRSATPGTSIPNPELDYTVEREQTDKDISSDVVIQVPVFIPDENADTRISAKLGFGGYNFSKTYSEIFSDKEYTAVPETDIIQDDVIDKASKLTVGGSYGQSINSPFFEDEDKNFSFGGSAELIFWGKKFEKTLIDQDKTFTAGAGSTDGERNEDSEKLSGRSVDLSMRAQASHSFSYELDNNVKFKMTPSISAMFERKNVDPTIAAGTPNTIAQVKNYTFVEKADNNSDGDFTDSGDTITTVTIEGDGFAVPVGYDLGVTNFSDTPYPVTQGIFDVIDNTLNFKQTAVNLSFNPSCAMQFQPEDWDLGFTLGAQANLSMTREISLTKEGEAVITTVTEAGDGSSTSTVVQKALSNKGKMVDTVWDMSINHGFGMNLDVSDDVQILFDLSSATSLFDFDNLTVQALVSLP